MKFYLGLLVPFCLQTATAQVVFTQDFEDAQSMPPRDWRVIDDTQEGTVNHWKLNGDSDRALSGQKCAMVSAGSYMYQEPVKDEYLVTPPVALEAGTDYQISFLWQGASAASLNKKEYDFQVRVKEVSESDWTTVWSFLNEEDVINSGVPFPWTGWETYCSKVDISAYSGKTVEIAFVHSLLKSGKGLGNNIKLDDITLEAYSAITTPVASTDFSQYLFSQIWMGATRYSEPITLTNTGIGTLKIASISGLEGTDFGCTIVPEEVSLKKGESYRFNFTYAPTLTGRANATLRIEVEGGNVLEIPVSGTKRMLPAGYTYEGFEKFPPVGWTNRGWYQYAQGISGQHCALASVDDESSLITPLLDLSDPDREYSVYFTFEEDFDPADMGSQYPESYFCLYLSKDGGKHWGDTIWCNLDDFNKIVDKEVKLGSPKSDSCMIKFTYLLDGFASASYDDLPEYALSFLDDVVLPPFLGADGVPAATTLKSPANGAKNLHNSAVTLSWNPVLFATDYKLYCGTADGQWNVLDGVSMGEVNTYRLPRLEYATTYYWKVVPCNAKGDAQDVKTWNFTTIADQSVITYPYFEGFEGNRIPLGWLNETTQQYVSWDISNNGYDGNYAAYVAGSYVCVATLETPTFDLPADSKPHLSFFWGNHPPTALGFDPTGTAVNQTTGVNDIEACFFEVSTGETWETLALMSDVNNEVWVRENIDLTAYAGKKLSLRWRYEIYNSAKNRGVALDNVSIDLGDNCAAYLNTRIWEAGKVNNGDSIDALNKLYLLNGSSEAMTVASATFRSSRFSTTLQAGASLVSGNPIRFNISYNAGTEASAIQDTLVIAFTNGQQIILPVSGETLAEDVLYYSFDRDEFGSTRVNHLKTVDMDKVATVQPTWIYYPNRGSQFAYIVINVTAECADWKNVYPVSGDQCLAAMRDATNSKETSDWLISPQLEATADSKMRFWAKSYGNTDQFDLHQVNVHVSTTTDAVNSFTTTVLSGAWLPYSREEKWTEFVVDLKQFAGQKIYVALEHASSKDSFVAFFDDLSFEHFTHASAIATTDLLQQVGVEAVPASGIFNLQGQRVKSITAPGMYIVNGRKVFNK